MTPTAQRRKKVPTGPRQKSSVAVLVSGGMDSAALLGFYLRERFRVQPLFVDFGQPAASEELRAAKSICEHYGVRLTIMTVRYQAALTVGEIPGRNAFLVFAAVLVLRMKPGVIAIGIHEGLPYYDCTEGFLTSIQAVVDGYSAGRIRVTAPFLKWGKQGIWEFCKKARVPVESTYSCEKGGVRPCRKCLSCRDREALDAL